MAKEQDKLDNYFKQKLEHHEEKPSQLAWERLEENLDKRPRKGFAVWYAAASLLLIGGLSFFLLKENTNEPVTEKEILVENRTVETKETDIPAEEIHTPTVGTNPEVKPSVEEPKQKAQPRENQNYSSEPETIRETIAQRELEDVSLPTIQDLSLPEVSLSSAIALVEPKIADNLINEEPQFTVTIKSSGIKAEEPKDNLIEEIETKVDKIGGFISRGFADLQDAKSNLFAINTPRRNKSTTTETP